MKSGLLQPGRKGRWWKLEGSLHLASSGTASKQRAESSLNKREMHRKAKMLKRLKYF